MYSPFQLAIKYARFLIVASNAKGHGVHSPFVFSFIKNVLNDRKIYDCYYAIEEERQALLKNHAKIEVVDFGAGSSVIKTNSRAISKMAASSLKPRKYAQLLFRMAQYYKPETIIELGTSFGITTSYLASGNPAAKVFTLEGAPAIAALAKQHFEKMQLNHISLLQGSFDKTLPELLQSVNKVDMVFIDGNHRKEPTIQYFETIRRYAGHSTIFIFDDIHWSKGMEEAWEAISMYPDVTLTIDLFFIGIVFVNPDFKIKQQFRIRF